MKSVKAQLVSLSDEINGGDRGNPRKPEYKELVAECYAVAKQVVAESRYADSPHADTLAGELGDAARSGLVRDIMIIDLDLTYTHSQIRNREAK